MNSHRLDYLAPGAGACLCGVTFTGRNQVAIRKAQEEHEGFIKVATAMFPDPATLEEHRQGWLLKHG